MEAEILPDSPIWSFSNSSNISDVNSFFIAYCATSKIVLLDIASGKAYTILTSNTQNGKPRKAQRVSLSSSSCAGGFNDGLIAVWDLGIFQESWKYQGKSEISGLKWWNDFIVCAFSNGNCIQIKDGEAIKEWNSNNIRCMSANSHYLAISAAGKIKIFDFDKEFQIEKDALSIDIKEWDNELHLAAMDDKKITGYKNMQICFEYSLPKAKKKAAQLVLSIIWFSKEKCIYSLMTGEIFILKIIPQVTTQLFINNPHTRAIMAFLPIQEGIVSIGMDRLIINWKIQQFEIEGPSYRVSSAPIGYTEPLWVLATLEGSIHSMSIDPSGQVYICSGKQSIIKWIPLSSTIQSRFIWKSEEEIQQILCNPFNSDIIAILSTNQHASILSIPEEKITNKLELLKIKKIVWQDAISIIVASDDQSLFCWDITNQNLKSIAHVGFDVTAICFSKDMVWIGTQEGNILAYLIDGTRVYADTTHNKAITCISSGSKIAAASEDCRISIHQETCELVIEKHTRPVLHVDWSSHEIEKLVSASMDHTVQIWDSIGNPLINIREHQGAVRFSFFHPTIPNTVISASDDQTVRLWPLNKAYSAQVPPRLPLSKKNETYTKSLFSHLHFYIYQQNREEALSSLLEILNDSGTIHCKLFSTNSQNAYDLIQDAKNYKDQIECLFWQRSAERQEVVDVNEPIKLNREWSDLAPLLGENQWREESRKNGEEMLLRRKIHKSVLYFIAARMIKRAIKIYVSSNLFIEAVILGALHNEDISEIFRMWAKRLADTCKQEQAAKCLLAIKDYQQALILLESLPYTNPQLSNLIEILKSKIN
ncbi:unnamed protein product [Blepharisma stoltei]|uniref:Gem-associated protein 5 TPR domain-containing protein n=1 Tax=Blepharisma stoltei TaxID=1481888 RepID=A0AAU9JHM5_9CILI|nr:unnamed protein product [Blepharisma stoltei]